MSEDKWISVEDRLPPDSENVLTVVIDGETKAGYDIEINYYQHCIGNWLYSHREVLFWQPLPDLPEGVMRSDR